MRIIAALVLCLAIAGCATKQQPVSGDQANEKLTHAAREIIAIFENQMAHPEAGVVPNFVNRLNNDSEELRTLLAAIPAGTDTSVAAHYYLAQADDAINRYHVLGDTPIDAAKAKEAGDSFAVVIAYGKDVPSWGIKTMEVLYEAGLNAFNYTKNKQSAFKYWHACSDMGHGGCMNNVANELAGKPDASDRDREEAFTLFDKISQTGLQYRCGGLFSAVDAAMMIHLHDVKRPAGDEFKMLDRARNDFTTLQEQEGTADPCSGAFLVLDEYMMRADSGDLRPGLLDEIILMPANENTRHIAEHLHADKNDVLKNAQSQVDAERDCHSDFYMLWRSVQLGARETAAQLIGKVEKSCDGKRVHYAKMVMAAAGRPKTKS